MKITHRVIADEVRGANTGPLRDFPFGFRVPAPTGNPTSYCLELVSRKPGAPALTLCCGSPREIMSAMKAVLLILPVARSVFGDDLAQAVAGLLPLRDDERVWDFYGDDLTKAGKALARFRRGGW